MNKPMTQKQVEDFILLSGQSGKRWFKLSFIDEDMNNDPTACALMDVIADAVHAGMMCDNILKPDIKVTD